MGRRRKGRPLNGWLVIDKPLGLTSNAVVGQVRRLMNAAKVGHGGTLDPLATGLLPLAFGEATKTVSYVMDGRKTYRFTVRWGEARTTDDAEGTVSAVSDVRPERAAILAVLPRFQGLIEQIPPAFSAIKVDGERAYDLARAQEEFELAPRPVRIDSLELIDQPDPDHARFEVACGKGTYMRALARDLALALGTVGHVAELRRTAVGPFTEKHAISLEKLGPLVHSAPPETILLPIATALDDIPALALIDEEIRQIRNGQELPILALANRSTLPKLAPGGVVLVTADGAALALTRVEGGALRPFRVLNIEER